jgi:UDPglucose 6-dehydrogenase
VVERVLDRPDVTVVSNPEFLREGSAVQDFLHPDRVVVGATDQAAAIKVSSLYLGVAAPVIVTDPASAETIKYAANAFLATKLSYVNAVAAICEGVGADINDVVLGLGYDHRIGRDFLRPGPGWGGSCFDGAETLLVRDVHGISLVRFDEIASRLERAGDHGLEALAWAPGAPRPDFRRVIAATERSYDGEMVELRTKMGRRLRVTADHPFVARRRAASPGIVLARELTDGHWLPIALGEPVVVDPPIAELSVLDAIAAAGASWSDVHLRLTDEQVAVAAALTGVLPTSTLRERVRSRTMSLHEAALLRLPLRGARAGTTTNGTYVPLTIPLDEEMWEVIGLYLAEGNIATDGRRRRVCWSFHPRDEEHLVDTVAGKWERLGVKVSVRTGSTARHVSISSRILAAWFEHVLGAGVNAYDHRIPDAAWEATVDQQRALLRGLWAGDGSWSYVAGGPSVVLEYGTVSRELADGMLRLLAAHGVVARLKVGRTAKSTVDTYWLTISGADQVEAAIWLLEEHERADVLAALGRQAKRIAPTGYVRDGKGTAWVRVTTVETRAASQSVYSVEVEGLHTVVTSFGLVAHNCFPKDTRAMLRIAEDAGYRFDLLDGVVAVNEEQFERVAAKVRAAAGGSLDGRTIGVWGLTFKAGTDDLRDSPSLAVIERLLASGSRIKAHDPTVSGPKPGLPAGIEVCTDPYAVCEGADVLVVLTEWDEYRWLDPKKVLDLAAGPAVVDGRNMLDRNEWTRLGFNYQGIGR